MAYTVVCISRHVGAGGEEIGRGIADRLGFRFVDEEIVQRAAAESGVDPESVANVEERRTVAGRLLDAMEQAAIAMPEAMAWAPDAVLEAMPKEGLRELIKEAVRQT